MKRQGEESEETTSAVDTKKVKPEEGDDEKKEGHRDSDNGVESTTVTCNNASEVEGEFMAWG